jgi:hypothetical protein
MPGQKGAHEKGGVEGEVGRFRRNHLVPLPSVSTLAELNALIDQWDAADDLRRIGSRAHTVGEYFATERPLLQPLPDEPFETGRVFHPRVDHHGQICVRMNYYSVPVRLVGRKVRVLLHASELAVFDGKTEVARHERLIARGKPRLVLDHYLEILIRKPGALPGSTALEQARQAGKFTPVHDAWWAAVRRAHGDAEGTRALIEVLLLHRGMAHEHVVAGIAAALRVGALTSDVVAIEARKAAHTDPQPADQVPAGPVGRPVELPPVTSLTQRRLADLPPDTRPLPSVAAYERRHRYHTCHRSLATPPRRSDRARTRRRASPSLITHDLAGAPRRATRQGRLQEETRTSTAPVQWPATPQRPGRPGNSNAAHYRRPDANCRS